MLKLAGKVLDVHDDIGLHRFRELVPDSDRKKVAAGAELLSPEEMEGISDNRFGAVFYTAVDGSAPRRAYLLTTPQHTKISAMYFSKAAEERLFPDPVRNAIAAQIHHGMQVHGVKTAEVLGQEKAAEFDGWVAEHGDWSPGDNFIDCSLFENPAAPEVEKYAFSKTASGMRKYMFPCDSPDQVRSSIAAILAPNVMEDMGIDAGELCKAASALKFAAETHDVEVPEGLIKFACVDPRPMEDIETLLHSRLAYVNADKRADRAGAIKIAMAKVLEEKKPAALVAKIALLDRACGIGEAQYYRGCARPFDVVYTGAKKEATDADFIESVGGLEHVKEVLGEKVAEQFKSKPKETFQKQSKELQHILLHAR